MLVPVLPYKGNNNILGEEQSKPDSDYFTSVLDIEGILYRCVMSLKAAFSFCKNYKTAPTGNSKSATGELGHVSAS